MPCTDEMQSGQTVRLTMPYLEAERGMYTVVYVYRNGWLGVVSHSDGQLRDVPAQCCRHVAAKMPKPDEQGTSGDSA